MSNHVTVAVAPYSGVEVGGEPAVGDQPPLRTAKSDPEPDSDESPKPKRKERLARKAYSVDEMAEITSLSPATIWQVRKAKSDPEPDSDEGPKPKRKERLERKAYSVDETAEMTNLSPATIWRLISAKKLATVKVGGRRLVPNPAIDALLAAD
jgi:excisionase family DNA binding protein